MPISVVCEACHKQYSFKDEYGGKKVRCADCGAVMEVPVQLAPIKSYEQDDSDLDPAFRRDKFLLRQKIMTISEKYEVFDENDQPIMFVVRPAFIGQNLLALFASLLTLIGVGGAAVFLAVTVFKGDPVLITIVCTLGIALALGLFFVVLISMVPKRHIQFYTDSEQDQKLLEVLQDRKVMIINATYTCTDPDGSFLCRFRKNYLYNILRKRWYLHDEQGEILAVAMEDSIILSLLRRLLGPLFGLLRTNFIITKPDMETVIGEFNRKFTLFDRYVLDMSADQERYLDRRLAVALGVLLDTGEQR